MHEQVTGLDVHKAMIADVRLVVGGMVKREYRTFERTTGLFEGFDSVVSC
jgi:hypothetical protein